MFLSFLESVTLKIKMAIYLLFYLLKMARKGPAVLYNEACSIDVTYYHASSLTDPCTHSGGQDDYNIYLKTECMNRCHSKRDHRSIVDSFTTKISLVILLTVFPTILMVLIRKI